jgi:hypothetical protein
MIRYIITANEEEEPLESEVTRFMRAFEGGFERGMAFTLYMPNATRILLYVAEEGANSSAGPRAEFNRQCEAIKKPLYGRIASSAFCMLSGADSQVQAV